MKVYRETQTEAEHIRIGDKIDIEIDKKTWKATAVHREGNRVLFVLDEVICEHRMNPKDTTKGGYEASKMRKYLDELTKTIPDEILNVMQPDSLGDHLWLLSLQEVHGIDEGWNDDDGQIEWFKDRRHRIAPHNGKDANWWLRSVTSASYFALVAGGGVATDSNASGAWVGVRPAFAIFDPESPSLVDGDKPENKARKEINDKTGEIIKRMCDKYCKWPAIWDKDILGMSLEDSGICDECPLNDLEV